MIFTDSYFSEALKPVDQVTRASRGYFILTKSQENCEQKNCTMKNFTRFRITADKMKKILNENQPKTSEEVIRLTLSHFMDELGPVTGPVSPTIAQQLQTTQLYQIIHSSFQKSPGLFPLDIAQATLFFFACPSQFFKSLHSSIRSELLRLRSLESVPQELNKEVFTFWFYFLPVNLIP